MEDVSQRPEGEQAQDTGGRTPGSSSISTPGSLGHNITVPLQFPCPVLGALNTLSPLFCPTTL